MLIGNVHQNGGGREGGVAEDTSGNGFNCTASVSGLLAVVCLLQGFFLTLHQGCVLTLLNY